MRLLDLPPEVLGLTLKWLDPNSLYLASLVCKTLRTAILSSKSLLSHHLLCLPGFAVNCCSLTTPTISSLLTSRLEENLLCGVNILADRTWHQFTQRANVKASLLQLSRWPSRRENLLLVNAFATEVDVYFIKDNELKFAYTVGPHLLAEHEGFNDLREYRLEVLKTAVVATEWEGCSDPLELIVLYRYSFEDDCQNSFVRTAAKRSNATLKLVKFEGTDISTVRNIPIVPRGEVLGMAASYSGTVAIALRTPFNVYGVLVASFCDNPGIGKSFLFFFFCCRIIVLIIEYVFTINLLSRKDWSRFICFGRN